ncbi:Tim44 [Giardia muris]|uniref:Tim44 n=1 Tax=Giardia muris TaxID=5742 RepID=A0A4Z1SM74_GIAMU|nr:Tim44 [Giardia muris]|eukprot:TNJ26782.1 Tim44 [Giardia muris]
MQALTKHRFVLLEGVGAAFLDSIRSSMKMGGGMLNRPWLRRLLGTGVQTVSSGIVPVALREQYLACITNDLRDLETTIANALIDLEVTDSFNFDYSPSTSRLESVISHLEGYSLLRPLAKGLRDGLAIDLHRFHAKYPGMNLYHVIHGISRELLAEVLREYFLGPLQSIGPDPVDPTVAIAHLRSMLTEKPALQLLGALKERLDLGWSTFFELYHIRSHNCIGCNPETGELRFSTVVAARYAVLDGSRVINGSVTKGRDFLIESACKYDSRKNVWQLSDIKASILSIKARPTYV